MTTLAVSIARFRLALKRHKKNPDWARIQEPDTFIPPFVLLIFTLVITASAGMINYAFAEPGTLERMIAAYLAPFIAVGDQSFAQVYAVFTFATLAIIESLVFTFIAILQPPDNDDLAEMIRDLDDNTQERIVELEHTMDERLSHIENEVGVTFREAVEEIAEDAKVTA